MAGVALVAVATALVGRSRPDLDVQRILHPPRTHAGGSARVDVRIRNRRNHRSPVLRLHDPVTGTAGADLYVGPLGRDAHAAATYQLPTEHRGVITVGPLTGAVVDPFGIAERRFPVSGTSELTVLPRTHRVWRSGARSASTIRTPASSRPTSSASPATSSTRFATTSSATTCAGCTGRPPHAATS